MDLVKTPVSPSVPEDVKWSILTGGWKKSTKLNLLKTI